MTEKSRANVEERNRMEAEAYQQALREFEELQREYVVIVANNVVIERGSPEWDEALAYTVSLFDEFAINDRQTAFDVQTELHTELHEAFACTCANANGLIMDAITCIFGPDEMDEDE